MQIKPQEKIEIQSHDISKILINNYSNLMALFYELQSYFLSSRYKLLSSLETSNIIICFARNLHLSIVRKREINLDFDLSFENFIKNINVRNSPIEKIVSIVNETGIPKETVRRKIIKLIERGYISSNKNREYYWKLSPKREDTFKKLMTSDINIVSNFVHHIAKYMNISIDEEIIKKEINKNFSFYFYHYYSCQLLWFKMWRNKVKDVDLILITLQALIPALQYVDKSLNIKNISIENFYTIIGKTNENYKISDAAVSASSIAEITGIPRATCIRKLEKLTELGVLVQDKKTKRYYLNQLTTDRTKNIITQENILHSIKIFSDFLVIVMNALVRNLK